MTESAPKPAKAGRRTDVDALLSEVADAAKAAAKRPAKAAPTKAVAKEAAPPAAAVAAEAPATKKTLRVRQVKSGICAPYGQKATLRALGLRRIRHEVSLPDNASTRGQILKVRHLVAVVGE